MAVTGRIHITEYAFLATEHYGRGVQAGKEPAITEQVVAIGATSAQSNGFAAATRFIRIDADMAAYYKVGANPTAAAASSKYIQAGGFEYYGVEPGHKLACIQVPA